MRASTFPEVGALIGAVKVQDADEDADTVVGTFQIEAVAAIVVEAVVLSEVKGTRRA